ncbi:MAG: ligase-associated DNA damage response DEXH box helicase [Bacteroidetes bacterium]|nr:ligase-associated DNA damage response DEXH box helicase [Bacteroidota bacterium]
MTVTEQIDIANSWFSANQWKSYPFQEKTWMAYLSGSSGLLNAPTGSGKTYALIMPIILEMMQMSKVNGLQAIWIAPIRALTKEIKLSADRLIGDWNLDFTVAVRIGDTSAAEKQAQKTKPPNILITTPESWHILIGQKGYQKYFRNLKAVIVDEWHELLGSKRGVQVELALSRMKGFCPNLKIWGISATIGNLDEAMTVLQGVHLNPTVFIKSNIEKKIEVESVLPEDIEKYPWAGHLGIKMIDKVIPIINRSRSTLIFTNTRSFCEIWYQKLLDRAPELAGQIAMHHGSLSKNLRNWVEDALHEGHLKAVVCTSSLDLGVDFRPVETVIQIGSPKGVARFIQRAGRSGHQPGAASKIYFVPTHALELVEAIALKRAIETDIVEARIPFIRSFDVLLQYLMTLAISDGFEEAVIYKEITSTYAFESVSKEEWYWCLDFLVNGGKSMDVYDEFHKMVVEDGIYKVVDRRVAQRHRLSIGTIVSDQMLQVKFISGGRIGSVEEYFVSKLQPGDVFWFSGRALEFIRLKGMVVQVRRSQRKTGKVPSFQGGRMPLSSQMSKLLRETMHADVVNEEYKTLQPLLKIQRELSIIPTEDEFLIEYFQSNEGYHLVVYPFEGRLVHEGLGALIAYRISLLQSITFSIAMNDYGLELLSEDPIDIREVLDNHIFSTDYLKEDIQASVNATEMARRRFRDIASISGMVFSGFPGKIKKERHMQASSGLLFNVFYDYDPTNLLLRQAYEEAMDQQLEEGRLKEALKRINQQDIVVKHPKKMTPFAFPIIVDRLSRSHVSSEKLEDRVQKMQLDMKLK